MRKSTSNLFQRLFLGNKPAKVHVNVNNKNEEETEETEITNIATHEYDTVVERLIKEVIEDIINEIINDDVKSVPESHEDDMICGICLDLNTEPFMTSCHHSFCVHCLYRVHEFKYDFTCPLCRSEITNKADMIQIFKNKKIEKEQAEHKSILPPFNPENYPDEVDFSFIRNEMFIHMFLSAYNVITREEKWKLMHDYNPPSSEGFMWSTDPEINLLMNKINDDYGGHSGSSMAFTMRKMQFIGIYGYNEFKNEWIRWN